MGTDLGAGGAHRQVWARGGGGGEGGQLLCELNWHCR